MTVIDTIMLFPSSYILVMLDSVYGIILAIMNIAIWTYLRISRSNMLIRRINTIKGENCEIDLEFLVDEKIIESGIINVDQLGHNGVSELDMCYGILRSIPNGYLEIENKYYNMISNNQKEAAYLNEIYRPSACMLKVLNSIPLWMVQSETYDYGVVHHGVRKLVFAISISTAFSISLYDEDFSAFTKYVLPALLFVIDQALYFVMKTILFSKVEKRIHIGSVKRNNYNDLQKIRHYNYNIMRNTPDVLESFNNRLTNNIYVVIDSTLVFTSYILLSKDVSIGQTILFFIYGYWTMIRLINFLIILRRLNLRPSRFNEGIDLPVIVNPSII
jgi:hypothetical protein